MKSYETKTYLVRRGEEGRLSLGKKWLESTWKDREECSLISFDEFYNGLNERLVELDRYEIGVFRVTDSGAKTLEAAAVVAFDHDLHVGLTLSVEVAYSSVKGLGSRLMREYIKLARQGCVKTVRVIRRVGPYNYNVRYVKVPEIQE